MPKITLVLIFILASLSLNAKENYDLVQQSIQKNGITFLINNSKYLDNDTVSSVVITKKENRFKSQVLETLISYGIGNPNSFKIRTFDKLSSNFVAIQEWTGGGSCCVYIHIYSTYPKFKKVFTYKGDRLKFINQDTILSYEDRTDIDTSSYPLCCIPQKIKEVKLNPGGIKVLKEYNLDN